MTIRPRLNSQSRIGQRSHTLHLLGQVVAMKRCSIVLARIALAWSWYIVTPHGVAGVRGPGSGDWTPAGRPHTLWPGRVAAHCPRVPITATARAGPAAGIRAGSRTWPGCAAWDYGAWHRTCGQNAARLWRRILTADPEAIFGAEASRLMNRNWADRLPQPGYMGRDTGPVVWCSFR